MRFQMIIAGGSDDPGKLVFGNMKKRRGGQKPVPPKRFDSLFNIRPGRVLGQDGPDHHLKRMIGRPPMKIAEISVQNFIYFQQFFPKVPGVLLFFHFVRGTKKVDFPRLINSRMLPFSPAFAISF